VPCRCRCGREYEVGIADLYTGKSPRCRWCGDHSDAQRNVKIHGAASTGNTTPEYNSWVGMNVRCKAAAVGNLRYAKYVGVIVAREWTGDGGFQRFLADVGYRPSRKHSLDRYPNSVGNYEPGNVRWATQAEKNRNKSNIRLITYQSRTLCLKDWAKELRISYVGLAKRIKDGIDFAVAVSLPFQARSTIAGICGYGHIKSPNGVCKTCRRTHDSFKRARKLSATPGWLTDSHRADIFSIYAQCPDGHQVDHIIPLQGKTVCGLHVPWNLQHLSTAENSRKRNRLLPDLAGADSRIQDP
jgi:hypothetical protein